MINVELLAAKVETLQPGFLVITRRRGTLVTDCLLPWNMWEQLQARGFYGGIVLDEGRSLQSLGDDDLAKLGLMRVPSGGSGA